MIITENNNKVIRGDLLDFDFDLDFDISFLFGVTFQF